MLLATNRKISSLIRDEIVAQADSESYLINSLAGIATIKASGAEDHILSHWSDLFHRGLKISIQQQRVSSIIDLLLGTLHNFAPLALLLFGANAVLANQMSLGTLLALNALAIAFLSPLTSLVFAGRQFYLVNVNLERVADVLEKEPEQPGSVSSYNPVLVSGKIALEHVCFRYTSESPMVLLDISCQIDPGQKVAIVGRSGSGKSTLALLLIGLYRPTSGKISYDGIELEKLDYHALRRQFGIVLQDPFLVNGTIRQNIAFNAPDLSLDEIMAAASLAGIHDEISRMPMGYETFISEGGFTLAGGQRQRLAIARAIARQPKILIFDEATSHLDAITESAISRNLDTLACTRIIIAHRLSTIRDADHILVIHDGCLVEQGTHEQLMALNQHYANLVNNQSLEPIKV